MTFPLLGKGKKQQYYWRMNIPPWVVRNGTFEAIHRGRGIHSFTDDGVDDEEIEMLLEAARWTPTAENNRLWRLVVVRNQQTIEKLIRAAVPGHSMNFVRRAPVVIAICADLTI